MTNREKFLETLRTMDAEKFVALFRNKNIDIGFSCDYIKAVKCRARFCDPCVAMWLDEEVTEE